MRSVYVVGDSIGEYDINLEADVLERLYSNNIVTYDDLLRTPAWRLRKDMNWVEYLKVKNHVHEIGYDLLGEDIMLGLSSDRETTSRIADMPLADSLLPEGIITALRRYFDYPIVTVSDLLVVDYKVLAQKKSFGKVHLQKICDFVYELGTTFYDDTIPYVAYPNTLRRAGIMPIEDLGLTDVMCKRLHEKGVHSFQELYNYVQTNEGFGSISREKYASLKERISNMRVYLKEEEKPSIEVINKAWHRSFPEDKKIICTMDRELEYESLTRMEQELEKRLLEVRNRKRQIEYLQYIKK